MNPSRRKKWTFFPENLALQDQLARELNITRVLAKCLLNRSIQDTDSAKVYLQPELGQLIDPFRFTQMEKAVERVRRALDHREKILIHGDYDVDGVSGTCLLLQFFRILGADVTFHIPNRIKDGYSFNPAGVAKIKKIRPGLVITIDNGITAAEAITELKRSGIDVLITDHHRPAENEPLPPAVAILNPGLPDSGYPHQSLCGVAVAFKLAWGMAQSLGSGQKTSPRMKQFLVDAMGWVAVGTISDIVPLVGENRVFAKFGLAALAQSPLPGVQALLRVCGVNKRSLSSEDVAFRIGPRINAAGRLGAAEKAVELLTTTDVRIADSIATELDRNNEIRKDIEREIYEDARQQVRNGWDFQTEPLIVLASRHWHPGVVGIVCSRLVDEFHAPTILVSLDGNGMGRGSGRAMNGFALHRALSECAPVLTKFGGHAQAAGLEIEEQNFPAFREMVNRAARNMLASGLPEPTLPIDSEILISNLQSQVLDEIHRLAPYGPGNEEPVFASTDLRVVGAPRLVGKNQEHVQFQLEQGGTVVRAIGFRMSERAEEILKAESLSIAFTPKWNHWRGKRTLNLEVRDFVSE